MGNYLVTGAAGFIGSAVARKLIAGEHEVVTIDNLSTGNKNQVPDGVELIECNCQDSTVISKLGDRRFDAILHIAGQSSGEVSYDDPIYDLQTNGQATLMLMKHALSIGCKKFVYASTMSVYGESVVQPVNENIRPLPKSFYAVGKLASENYMRVFSEMGLATTALRLFNVYGPCQNLKNNRQGMISIYLSQAIQRQAIHVKGSGDRYRDHVYIDDVVDAFLKSMMLNKPEFRVFNIGSGVKTKVKKVVDAIRNGLSNSIFVKYDGATPGDIHGIYADVRMAKRILNWSPTIDFKSGMDKMIKWATVGNKSMRSHLYTKSTSTIK